MSVPFPCLGGVCPRQQRLALAVAAVAFLALGTPAGADPPAAPQAGAFWAVAGSFLNRRAAQSAMQEVARKTGAAPAILVADTPAGATHRVVLGPWPSATEAAEAVRRLRDAGYADAWKLGGEGVLASHAQHSAQPPVEPAAQGSTTPATAASVAPTPVAEPRPAAEPMPNRAATLPASARPPSPAAGAASDRAAALSYQAELRATAAFGTTAATPTKQKEELSLIAGIRADFGAPKALGLTAFHVTTRIRREGSDALVPGRPSSPSAVRHHLDAYAEVELRQAWADIRRDDWHFRIGRQTVVWGETRGLKVLDIVNPQSYREFLLSSFDRARTPLWMLNAERQVGEGTLQALLVLEREGHRLPRTGGVFAQALYADRPKPPGRRRYRDLEPGLRYSFAMGGWALTANALRHRDDWPVWREGETGARAAFEPRMTTLGASAAKTYGDYAVRVEATLSDRRHFHGRVHGIYPSPEFAAVVGVGWTALANTRLDVQLFQTSTLDHVPNMGRDETEMTAVVRAERTFPGSGLAASLTTHHGLSGQGALIRPRLTWRAGKALALTAFADIFEGRQDVFYGQFDHRDRVGLTIELAH